MLDQDRFPGARTDERGRWQIPIADLEALGYTVNLEHSTNLEHSAVADDQVRKLEAENNRLRTRLAVAEALAAERLRLLDTLSAGIAKGRR